VSFSVRVLRRPVFTSVMALQSLDSNCFFWGGEGVGVVIRVMFCVQHTLETSCHRSKKTGTAVSAAPP
jgi:hypothetical protein